MDPTRHPLPRPGLRAWLLALGIACTSLAAAQSAPELPTNPALGPAFATRNAAYTPVLFEEIPGWEEESLAETRASFATNCRAMQKRPAWAPICARLARLPRDDEAMRRFLREEFYAYQMLTPTRSATGKLTGYFEPLIAGSLRREGAYRYPVYGMPADMYQVESRTIAGLASRWLKPVDGRLLGAEPGEPGAREYRIELGGIAPNPRDKRYRVRIDGGAIRPYYTRQQIDASALAAPVLAWVADPFKLYSMQIQGSGKIQLKDGGLIRLAYAEQNGHPFLPNATRGDADAMLLAIKARALIEPEPVAIPGGTRGVGGTRGARSADDAEVARIVAALSGAGGSGSTSAAARPQAKPKRPSRPGGKRPPPASTPADATAVAPIQVESAEVEAMIQLLLHAPVAAPDAGDVAAVPALPAATTAAAGGGDADAAPVPRPAKSAPRPAAATLDMSEFEGKTSSVAAGQAVGPGAAVPATGINDPSYMFFRRIGDGPEGPIGALGVPLSAGRSMAVDPRATPLGAPVFIDGTQPGGSAPMRRLVFAQDTGGAIRGSVRGDFFWGFGDKAGRMALATNQPVRMWLLLPKAVAGSAASSGIKTRGEGGLRDCAVPDEEFCVED